MIAERQAEKVLEILRSTETSLRTLAEMSGFDPFLFYQGADLRGLDLSRQNLAELSFEKADLRFANLEGSEFDVGALNGAYLDESQRWRQDEFEFYAEDVVSHPINEVLIFCRMRKGCIDYVIEEIASNYRDFSALSGVSEAAIRKARRGNVVAHETASKIILAVEKVSAEIERHAGPVTRQLLTQPSIEFLSGGINDSFKHVGRDRMRRLIEMRAEIVEIRSLMYPKSSIKFWRDTPEAIDGMLNFYRKNRAYYEARNGRE